ncbi:MAG: hypothetical protein KJZ65_01475 [Phycisphaerales bacterium]|nr:hypothetical protein [Phycisphaerales bacterium]
MSVRLGEVLVARGLLSEAQRARILEAQETSGRPFGVLAEQMFNVSPRDVEQAWAEQFALEAERVDPAATTPFPEALASIERRQAWQFRVLPMRFERGELLIATDVVSLPRAMRFAGWRVAAPCRFLIAEPDALSAALQAFYPMPGFKPSELAALLKQAAN